MCPFSLPTPDLVFHNHDNLDKDYPERFLLIGAGVPALKVFKNISESGSAVGWVKSDSLVNALSYSPFTWLLNINSTTVFDTDILSMFDGQALNMHPAPLPEYAGLHCHYWGIKNREKNWAATVHIMEPGIDTGDVVGVQLIQVEDGDTPQTLFIKAMSEGVKVMSRVVNEILAGKPLHKHTQDLSKRKLYTRKMAAEDGWRPAIDEIATIASEKRGKFSWI